MADPDRDNLFRFRNPRTGETRTLTDPREIEASVLSGWVPEHPDTEVAILEYREGRAAARSVPLGDLGRIYDETGSIRLLDRTTGAAVLADTAERMRQRSLQEFGGTAATQSFLDVVSLGGASLAQDLLDPGVAGVRRDVIEANPNEALAGTVAGFGGQLLAGGAGALGRLGAGTGIGGLARGAGMAAEEMAASLGVRGRGAALAGMLAEEATAGAALEGALSLQQDRAFQAENALMDAGVGVAFGLGVRGLAGGRAELGERFARRVEATPSGRNAGEGLLELADTVDGRRTILDVQRMEQAPAPGWEGFSRATQVGADLPPSAANAITWEGYRSMAIDPEAAMTRAAKGSAEALDGMLRTEASLTESAFDQGWLARHADDFAAMDPEQTRALVRTQTEGLSQRITDWLAEQGPAVSRFERDGLVRLRELLDDFSQPRRTGRAVGQTPQQLFGGLVDLKRIIRNDIGPVTDTKILGDMVDAVRALPQNQAIWGRIGEIQAVRDHGLARLDTGQEALMRAVGRQDVFNPGDRVSSANAIRAAFKQAGGNVFDRYDDVKRAANQYQEAANELATRVTGHDPALVREFNRQVAEFHRWLDDGGAHARVKQIDTLITGRETRSHGALSMMGMGGGAGIVAVSALTGGPVGAALGALASIPFAFLVRPGGTIMRVARLRQALGNTAARAATGFGNVRRAATGGFRQRLGRFAARGVQSYYDLDNPKKRMREFEEMRRDITEMVQNPELATDRLAYTTAALNDMDPQLGDQAAFSAIRALFHLYAHMPQPVTDPLTGEAVLVPPSLDEITSFSRRYAVVEDPLVVLDRLAQGRLQPDEVDTLRVVYPETYGYVVAGVAAELAGIPPGRIRYDFRVQVGNLFGFQTDPTLDPAFVATMQNQGYQTSQQFQATQSPGRPLQRPLTATQHTLTTAQRLGLPE